MKIISKPIDLFLGLSKTISGIVKGASYTDREGKQVTLTEKDKIASSKKEVRNAAAILLRENISVSLSELLQRIRSDKSPIIFTPEEWKEYNFELGDIAKEVVSQIAANNRAGELSKGIIIIAAASVNRGTDLLNKETDVNSLITSDKSVAKSTAANSVKSKKGN